MNETKTLVVNCATCDATQTREETLQAYDQVVINAATVLISEQSAPLLHRYNVNMNAANILTVPAGAKMVTHNGRYTISGDSVPATPTMLAVNGSLNIAPGSQTALDAYVSITVNGVVSCPESLSGCLGAVQVNGSTECYPDGAVLLKRNFEVDRVFLLRAKANTLYHAARRVILTDSTLDLKKITDKGITFSTREAVIAEPLLESAIPLFGDEVEFTVVPEGCVFINDDLTLDRNAPRSSKFYINGNLVLKDECKEFLASLEYIYVNGTLTLTSTLEPLFSSLDAHYDQLKVVRANLLCDRPAAKVDRFLLEQGDGLSVLDCACVTLDKDITPQLILDRLDLMDCAVVKCTPEQRSAVEAVSTDVASIQDGEDGDTPSIGGLLKDVLTGKKKVINAAEYHL